MGALVNGPIVEQLGTRTTSIIGEVTIILGTAIGVLASNEHWLIIWRVVGGIGMGMCITSKPLYIVELSPHIYAGRLLAVLATSITFSMILAEASDMLIPHALEWIDVWRLLIALGMVFPTLLALFLLFCMPHTPAYFSTQGKTAAEEQPLARTSRESSAAAAAGAANIVRVLSDEQRCCRYRKGESAANHDRQVDDVVAHVGSLRGIEAANGE